MRTPTRGSREKFAAAPRLPSGGQGERGSVSGIPRRAARPSPLAPRPSSPPGFTLIELVLSLGIISVLTVAIGSAVVLAAQAIPTGKLPTDNAVLAAAAVDHLQRDLALATSFSERTATAVTFKVADRTGDGQPETIRYAWLNNAGGPLTAGVPGTLFRTINGVSAPVISDVSDVTLTYEAEAVTTSTTTYALVNSGEQELASFTGWSGVSASSRDFRVSSDDWIGQIVTPNVPAHATNLRITRVKLRLKGAGLLGGLLGGSVNVGIHARESIYDPRPGSSRIGTAATRGTGLLALAYEWTDFAFNDVTFTALPETLAIVVKGTSSGGSGLVNYLESSSGTNNGHLMRWNDEEGDEDEWAPGSGAWNKFDTQFYLYGAYDTLQPQTVTVSGTVLRAVSARVRVGSGAAAASSSTRVQTLNRPQVLP